MSRSQVRGRFEEISGDTVFTALTSTVSKEQNRLSSRIDMLELVCYLAFFPFHSRETTVAAVDAGHFGVGC